MGEFKKKMSRVLIQWCRVLRQFSGHLIPDKETLKSYYCLLSKPVLSKLTSCVQDDLRLCNNSYNEHMTMFYNLALGTSRSAAQVTLLYMWPPKRVPSIVHKMSSQTI